MTADELYSRFGQGPIVLMLGQGYLRLESGKDSFLSAVREKYGLPAGDGPPHDALLSETAYEDREAALAWMQHRCERIPVPDWLTTVAGYRWNSLFTSAVDTVWPKAFRLPWRTLQPVLDETYVPSEPRNRRRLHCTCLFGRVDRNDPAQTPPFARLEWLRRKQVAVALARRIPETVSPFGTLAIEGYDWGGDWLGLDEIIPIIDAMEPDQVHVFGAPSGLAEQPMLASLINSGKLSLHAENLATFLQEGTERGLLQVGLPAEGDERRQIRVGQATTVVPDEIWNAVTQSATILDDAAMVAPRRLSAEKRYAEFRHFLSESSAQPVWPGYAYGFAFRRDFEVSLRDMVETQLKSKALQKAPIIVHGQTGTGKTVAFGRIAYEVRRDGQYPVLFIERRPRPLRAADIDAFCRWAEKQGAPATLVVWDGMVDIGQYYDLTQYLAGRGRKAVVVGSSYLADKSARANFIEAPANLDAERERFREFLSGVDPSLANVVDEARNSMDPTFLVLLYRLLPPTRGQIRSGVAQEVTEAGRRIRAELEATPDDSRDMPRLAQALLAAGLARVDDVRTCPGKSDLREDNDVIDELVGLVMVPGRFGIAVPVELLVRATGGGYTHRLIHVLRSLDIFRWREDRAGDVLIGPRHALEAMLVVQSRLGEPRSQVEYAKRLLIQVRDTDAYGDSLDIDFAIDLIRRLGPNGMDKEQFGPYFRDLSKVLNDLRETRGVQNPRLMLQEAALLREWVVSRCQSGAPPPDAEDSLRAAVQTIDDATRLMGDERRHDKFRSVMMVERASALGALARHLADCAGGSQSRRSDVGLLYRDARKSLKRSRACDPENYYPLDVLAWVTRDFITSDLATEAEKADATAEVLNAFDMAEEEGFDFGQLERFHMWRMKIGDLVGNAELSEDAFGALGAQGSAAGYYLRARSMTPDVKAGPRGDRTVTESERAAHRRAVAYLQTNWDAIVDDERCLYLLLRSWWLARAGRPIFAGERQTVAFDRSDWMFVLGTVTRLLGMSDVYRPSQLQYLQGLAAFQTGEVARAFEIFGELERDSGEHVQGRRRIIRSYLASTPEGEADVYDGSVSTIDNDRGRGYVYVARLRRSVPFFPREFGLATVRVGDAVDRFHIAFNFRGAVADPVQYGRM